MSKMLFSEEPVVDMIEDATELAAMHNAEVGEFEEAKVRPDKEMYQAMEDTGMLRCYTARADGELVGYAVFIIAPHPNYQGLAVARQDIMFVHPRYRGRGAVRFMKWQDERLAELEVDGIYRHVTRRLDFLGTLVAMGYDPIEVGFLRRV